jgi:two-component system OmpR family sensor kinase
MKGSIRTRLAVWNSAIMVLALAAVGAGVLWLHARWSHAQFDADLANLGAVTSRVLREELGEHKVLAKAAAEAGESIDVPGRSIAILDATGAPAAAEWHGFNYDRSALPLGPLGQTQLTTLRQGGAAWRVFTRRESTLEPASEFVILVAGPLTSIDRQQALLTRVLLVATPLVGLAAALLSWLAASSVLGPVTTMAGEAEAITARSPDWRLRASTARDEVGQLARAFNRLLDRLSDALRLQRQFMADASHELRTPVSVIQTAAEVTLDRPSRAEAEYRDAMSVVCEQSGRLGRMVEDMLVLARADAGGYALTRRLLYVDEIIEECLRAVSMVAATRAIRIGTNIQSDVSLYADDHLLGRLVMNLLDNAVQYTPADGQITVTLKSDANVVTLSVSDTGPGIPAVDRERVFDRFVRLDPARTNTTGAGLGLSIARWIAEQHDGTLALEDADCGCLFTLRLPTSQSTFAENRASRAEVLAENSHR